MPNEATPAPQPTFLWRGIDEQGQICRGTKTARDTRDLAWQLARERIALIGSRKRWQFPAATPPSPIGTDALAGFTRQLASLVAAGLPLATALALMAPGLTPGHLGRSTIALRQALLDGHPLHVAMAQQGRRFPALYRSLVRAGETTGSLDVLLPALADHLQQQANLRRRLRKALAYPLLLAGLTAVVTFALLIWVVPQFEAVFRSFGAELPLFTRLLIRLSSWLRECGPTLAGSGLALAVLVRILPYTVRSRALEGLEHLSLDLPVLGPVRRLAAVARLSRTLSITVRAGVPLVEALPLAADTTGSRRHRHALDAARQTVLAGTPLHQAMQASPLFPAFLRQMTAIGEESGTLDNLLGRAADHYEQLADHRLDLLTGLAEPVMMLVIGSLVGAIVVGMYLPIFQLTSVM